MSSVYDESKFISDLDVVLAEIRQLLIEKNRSYRNSALEPIKLLSKLTVRHRLMVRIDDKLNRLISGENFDEEDTILDLLGYFVIERIDANRNKAKSGL